MFKHRLGQEILHERPPPCRRVLEKSPQQGILCHEPAENGGEGDGHRKAARDDDASSSRWHNNYKRLVVAPAAGAVHCVGATARRPVLMRQR